MSAFEGFGYVPDGVQSAATKPVSGERIITSLERLDAIQDHGTKKGYEAGCRGSHCPGRESVGMSCSQASIRYAGDMGYRRRVDAGLSAEQIWVEDQAAHVVMPKVNVRDNRTRFAFDEPEITVEDSVAVYEADESYAAEEAPESVPQQQAEEPAVSPGERPAAAPAGKWAVRRVWVAVAPDGKLHGPFQSQPEAVVFVGEQVRPAPVGMAARRTRRSMTEGERATMRRLHAEGMSTTKMSQQMGRAVSVLSRELIAMGLTANGHRFGKRT